MQQLLGAASPIGICTQPACGEHESWVHELSSSQIDTSTTNTQSLAVNGQLSWVQGFPSSQFFPGTTHTPSVHTPWAVQPVPWSQDLPSAGAKTHPCWGSHVSLVQPLESLHVNGVPPPHTPEPQVVFDVQTFASSQLAPVHLH